MAFTSNLSDTELCYLELTAKHAPQGLGTADAGRMILLLLEENARLLDEQVCAQDLQAELDAECEHVSELEDELNETQQDLEAAEEEIERLEAEVDDLKEQLDEAA